MRLQPGQLWLPRSVRYAFGEPVVELVRLERPPPTFLSDLDLQSALESCRLPLADIELPDDDTTLLPDGLVFHMPRSGSTLFTRMLAAPDRHFCLVEVSAINALLSHTAALGPVDPTWLRRLLQIYRLGLGETAARLFVKTSSWMVLELRLFLEAFPKTPACFIHRDPVEVMVQIMERPPGWMHRDARPLLRQLAGATGETDDVRYSAAVLGAMCRTVGDAGARVRLLPYAELSDSGPGAMSDVFAVRVDERCRERCRAMCRLDSEDWSGRRVFEPDGEALRGRAGREIRELARTVVQPIMQRMVEQLSSTT